MEDILEELEGVKPPPQPRRSEPAADLDDTQRSICEFLHDRPRHIDEMAQQLGFSVPQIALMALEMKKAIRRLPGNQYERR